MRKSLITFLLPFIFPAVAFAQNPSCKPTVGGGITNVELLARKLTAGLDDDSLKVCSIYGWITSNIRYDIKKAGSFNYERTGVTQILKKKTAICRGYADLFNQLCKYAEIESVLVPGYVKSGGWYQGDSFYHAYHVWNAARVNGVWYLFDATWDAGYIESVRRTWKGKLLRIITFGSVNYYYYKPKFRQFPGTEYYMKSGLAFSKDHLPLHPVWQLMDTIISEKEFAKDSAAYFGTAKPDRVQMSDQQLLAARNEFAEKSESDQFIETGRQSHAFLSRNHLNFADALTLSGVKALQGIDPENTDSASVNAVCRKVLKWCDSAKIQYAATLLMMAEEKKMYSGSVKRIKDLCNSQNKQIVKMGKYALKICKKSHQQINNSVGYINKYIETGNEGRREAVKVNMAKVPWAEKESESKTRKLKLLDTSLTVLRDSIARIRAEMEKLEAHIYKIWDDNEDNSSAFYENNLWALDVTERKAKARFFQGKSDLNYEYSLLRDSLLNSKGAGDSQLLVKNKPLVDSLARLFKVLYGQCRQMHKLYKKQKDVLVKMKMTSLPDEEITDKYNTYVESYNDYIKAENDWVEQWRKPVKKIQQDYNESNKMVQSQIKIAAWEMKLEKRLQKGRTKWTKEFFAGSKEVVKNNQKLARETAREATKNMRRVAKAQRG